MACCVVVGVMEASDGDFVADVIVGDSNASSSSSSSLVDMKGFGGGRESMLYIVLLLMNGSCIPVHEVMN